MPPSKFYWYFSAPKITKMSAVCAPFKISLRRSRGDFTVKRMKPAKAQNSHWPKKHREERTDKPTQDTWAQSANGHLLVHLALPVY